MAECIDKNHRKNSGLSLILELGVGERQDKYMQALKIRVDEYV